MTLPRFTSGKVGNLEFSHLNEAFDILEGKQAAIRSRREPADAALLVRLIQKNAAGAFSWSEMTRKDDGTFEAVNGGVASTD